MSNSQNRKKPKRKQALLGKLRSQAESAKRQRAKETRENEEAARSVQSPRIQAKARAQIYNTIASCNRTALALDTGLSVSMISKFVSGDRAPSVTSARKIAKALGIQTADVVEYTEWVQEDEQRRRKVTRSGGYRNRGKSKP